MSLQGKTWEAFVALWGGDEEKARQWLEANPQARNRAIAESGLITREEAPEGEDEQPQPEPAEVVIDDDVIAAVARSVLESEAVTNLTTKLTEAEEQLVERAQAITELKTALEKMAARLTKLEGKQQAAAQQVEDDTPEKFKQQTRVVYRPRVANAAVEEDGTPYNQKANHNMPKGAY